MESQLLVALLIAEIVQIPIICYAAYKVFKLENELKESKSKEYQFNKVVKMLEFSQKIADYGSTTPQQTFDWLNDTLEKKGLA